MSRMAVWKERLGGTGFGSADQPEHRAWTDRKMDYGLKQMRSAQRRWAWIRGAELAEICCKAMGSEMHFRLESKALGSEALAKEALAS